MVSVFKQKYCGYKQLLDTDIAEPATYELGVNLPFSAAPLSLLQKGITLVTGIRRNMKNRLMSLWDKLMLRKRSIIETINDQLKNTQQIEHTRHRSPINFMINLLAGLIAYQLQPKKPAIYYAKTEHRLLTQPLLAG